MDVILDGIVFVVSLLAGVIALITGLFILCGGTGFVFWQAILYGLIAIAIGAGLLWVAEKAFNSNL